MSKVLRALSCAAMFVGAASVVSAADVQINIGVPPPPALTAQPPLVVVPNIPNVRYAPQAPYDTFYYGGQYYAYNNNGWFASPHVGAPWVYVERQRVPHQVLVVPARYYKIPPGHLKHKKGHGHGNDDD